MKNKALMLMLSGMLMFSTCISYAGNTTDIDEAAMMKILDMAKNHKDRDEAIEKLRANIQSDGGITFLKIGLADKLKENPNIRQKLNSEGVTESDLRKSLDGLKKWDIESRMKLVEYTENNQTEKLSELIRNDGKIEEPKPTPEGGGGGAKPEKENPQEKEEVKKEVKEDVEEIKEVKEQVKEEPKIEINFTDIENHWAKESIEHMTSIGIVSGVTENEFAPELEVTRSQMITFIVKVLELDIDIEGDMKFEDIDVDGWDYSFIKTAYNANLVNGVSAEQFAPNKEITREEMIAMIMNALHYKNKTQVDELQDISVYEDYDKISDWAKESMQKAVSLEIIKGETENTLEPDKVATRAEAIWMIEKVYNTIHN